LDTGHAQNAYPDYLWRNGKRLLISDNTNGNKGVYAPDLFTRAATNFIRSRRSDSFFLYVAFPLPCADKGFTNQGGPRPTHNLYAQEKWTKPEKDRAAMITLLDAEVGKIMSALWQSNLQRHTVVFFTGDTGSSDQESLDSGLGSRTGPLRGGSRQLYEGNLRVPMIVCWPGIIPSNITSDFPWAFWDFMHTVAQIADVTRPDGLDGVSVLPTFLGKDQKPHDYFYWEQYDNGLQQAARMGNWKALRHIPGRTLELYHLLKDPSESTNIAAAHPDVVSRMEDLFKSARTEPPAGKPNR
jgi:arylsulfatase A-like enzyme